MRLRIALAGLIAIATAAPAFAHSLSGTVYCDQNSNGVIDSADTGLSVLLQVTSLDVNPGDSFIIGSDLNGFYRTGLLQRSDRYRVQPVQLRPGLTVVVPAAGFQVATIITGTAQDTATGLDFLIQGCATTTSTTSTTTTTTSTTTTTTTTTLPVCNCPTAFVVGLDGRFNNDASIAGGVAANNVGGSIRLGRRATVADGSAVTADSVKLGGGSSIDDVLANQLFIGPGARVRGSSGTPTLPLVMPFCSLPNITCGNNDIQVSPGQSVGPLAPGTYGRLWVLDGGSLTLAAGQFTFCDIKAGRSASISTLGPATLNVSGNVVIGNGSSLAPAQGTDPVSVNAAGRYVRISDGASANAAFVAPNARITFGRGSRLLGCFCANRANSDKRINLDCPKP